VKPHELADAFGIIGIPLVDASARFIAPARFGDVVELTSQVSEFRRSSFDIEHRLIVRGALAVEGRETRVWAGAMPADPSQIKATACSRGRHRALSDAVISLCASASDLNRVADTVIRVAINRTSRR
jgi:acyl-CoA thioesterase FadM